MENPKSLEALKILACQFKPPTKVSYEFWPDGTLEIEWYINPNKVLCLDLIPGGILSYVCLFNGIVYLGTNVEPQDITFLLTKF